MKRLKSTNQGGLFLIDDPDSPYELRDGFHTGNMKGKLVTADPPPGDTRYKKAITSRERVSRFLIDWQKLWVLYDPTVIQTEKGGYASLRDPRIFEAVPKVYVKLFGKRLGAAVDHKGVYGNNSLILLLYRPNIAKPWLQSGFASAEDEFSYLVGILNSNLLSRYYLEIFSHTHVRGDFLQFYLKDLKQIPLVRPTPQNLACRQRIAELSRALENVYRDHPDSPNPPKDPAILPEIITLENDLNDQVRELYQLDGKYEETEVSGNKKIVKTKKRNN